MLVTKFAAHLLPLLLIAPAYAQSVGGFGASSGLSAYDGPSILGRTGPNDGMHGTEAHPIQVRGSITASYDTSMLGYLVDSNGNFNAKPSLGGTIGFGATGRKNWRRSFLGLDYSGDYGQYFPKNLYSGINQQLGFAVGTQVGQKLQINAQVSAGTSNRYLGGQSLFQAHELEFITAPTQELFNSRSYFIGNSSSATYSFDRRRSFRATGYASSVKRVAANLIDMQSYGASGDYVHRLNRATSIGVSYTFGHYDYQKVFGESDVNTIGAHVSRRFGRAWEFSGSVTGTHQSTVGVRSVALDPVLAAILGRPTGSEVFESNNLLYGYSAGITRSIRRSSVSVSARRGITPGNGYFLTSLSESIGANVSHSLSRDFHIGGGFGYSTLKSLGFTSGNFGSWYSGATLERKLTDTLGLNAGYDWRRYSLQQSAFGRNGHRISVGISYHPQGGPAGLF